MLNQKQKVPDRTQQLVSAVVSCFDNTIALLNVVKQ